MKNFTELLELAKTNAANEIASLCNDFHDSDFIDSIQTLDRMEVLAEYLRQCEVEINACET